MGEVTLRFTSARRHDLRPITRRSPLVGVVIAAKIPIRGPRPSSVVRLLLLGSQEDVPATQSARGLIEPSAPSVTPTMASSPPSLEPPLAILIGLGQTTKVLSSVG